MAILSNGKFYGFLCSVKETGRKLANGVKEYVEDFVSGFSGHGWKLWEYMAGKWKLEIDTIVVRETMIVFEMLISKIRAVVGAQAITQGHGRVKGVSVSEDGTEYLIVLEDEDVSILSHDFVRCQTFTGNGTKLYHVEIASVDVGMKILRVALSEFDRDELGNVLNPPAAGDELVQFGNSQNKARQSAIYLHADETGQPAIDVMFDLDSKNWEGKVKIRLGGGIPGTQSRGFYVENGMIKGVDSTKRVTYCIYPDGSAEFGDGSAAFRKDKSGFIAGGAIAWEWDGAKQKYVCTMRDVVLTWDNLSDDAKENLKGEPGKDGTNGQNGEPGRDGINGADGVNGKDGVSLVYKGEFASHPANPVNGWYYRDTTDKKCYSYQDGAWYVMTVDGSDGKNGLDGINGSNGEDGLDIVWKGDVSTPPADPQKNWAYRDTDNKRVYIYNGNAWELMIADGNDGTNGTNGTNGTDGMNVYITYHDSEAEPLAPSGDGTTNGWHTNATSSVVWMSQKVVDNASSGSWGNPIKIKGERGTRGLQGIQGERGEQGIQGLVGADGIASYFHIRYSSVTNPTSSEQMTETPDKYIGTYVDSKLQDSNVPGDYTWYRFQGLQGDTGLQGIPGTNGENGRTSYIHIKYSDDGGQGFTSNNGETPGAWIGVLVDFELNDSSTPTDYKWSKIKGEDGKLPAWLEGWNGYATELGEDYIVTPKMFSGTKTVDADGKVLLTGIAQGKDCLTAADGSKRTGIFALVDNEIVFELDPVNRSYKFKGEINAEKGNIGGFNIGSTGLYNKENRDCYVEMTNREYIGYEAGKDMFSERKAVLGNSLIALTGLQEVARMSYTGEEFETHRVLALVATGSAFTHNVFGGYDNLCVDAIGGCNWIQNKGDHWCMPGVLGIIRFSCSFSNNTYNFNFEKVWGNGIPGIGKSYISDTNEKVMVIEMDMGHVEYSVVGQAMGSTAKEGYYDLTPHIEYLVPGGFGISVWHNDKKYIPSSMDMMIFGRPYTKA